MLRKSKFWHVVAISLSCSLFDIAPALAGDLATLDTSSRKPRTLRLLPSIVTATVVVNGRMGAVPLRAPYPLRLWLLWPCPPLHVEGCRRSSQNTELAAQSLQRRDAAANWPKDDWPSCAWFFANSFRTVLRPRINCAEHRPTKRRIHLLDFYAQALLFNYGFVAHHLEIPIDQMM